ncbi:hemerythrin domain-containing protein [Streptomyces sp. NPDC058287]|uniref:hemerythrin domain-containing protein n=1 Tax=unclassified Streptomyces TaxID=2593676 RepID=UPI0036EB1248
MGHGGNVIAELTTDHREVDSLFGQIESQPVGDERRRELADELTMELVRHSVAEEEYLYPAVREYVDGGNELADKELEDHAGVEQLLKDLEGRGADDDQFNHLMAKLKLEVSARVRDEESRLFPLLTAACTAEMLDELGDKIRQAKKTAPTRPHPSVPSTPPGNKILGPGVGLVDRARDLLTGRNR